jgi:hypothetical protein
VICQWAAASDLVPHPEVKTEGPCHWSHADGHTIIAQPCLGSTRERSFVFVITNPRKKLAVTSFLLFPVFSARNRFSTNTTTNTIRCDSFLVSRTYVRVQLLARLTQYRSGLLKPPRVLVFVTLLFYNIKFVD